jgi:hypothetical protein
VLAALVPAYAIAILMPAGPDDGCPSPRQVNDALAAHLPAMVLPLGHATGPTTLHLAVTTDAAGAMRLDLTDPEGGPLLHRWLPAAERSRGLDCTALAETAALIVERYWHEVGYDVAIEPQKPPPPMPPPPPPDRPMDRSIVRPIAGPPETAAAEAPAPEPPPPPLPPARTWIGAAGGERLGDAGTHEATVSIAFAVERSLWNRRIGLRLSGGADRGTTYRWTASPDVTDRVTLREVPLRMGVYLSLPFGPGQIEPGVGVDLDVISAAVSDPSGTHTRLSAAPGGDAALAWSVRFRTNLYARLIADAGTGVPYRFVTTENQSPFWSTPRVYIDLGLESGFWFP